MGAVGIACRTVVLVEGASDRLALAAVAARLGADLPAAGVDVRSMDGITNLRQHLAVLQAGAAGELPVLGLYDANEVGYVAHTVGVGASGAFAELEALGFYACVRDLEDEVIRAAGPDLVEQALHAAGDLSRFRVFQGQPAQRARPIEAQLHRFAGTASGRKARFAVDIIDLLPDDRMPRPLVALVETAMRTSAR
ncbi:TOPRIM nucleotidyl transferase/hydrolase domain-containing protein [Agromyces sp. G08B096]|uniref:TOPRIM nucleotidyl transferase/hydrolase domain-containing protein n=1 Tax=Agromyces sp. G08B096 TaxID=3156399 RepID=A0AAU7WAH9_9MICO